MIAMAVNTDGKREMRGMTVGPSDAEPLRRGFLRSLTCRGLLDVRLAISDAHEGLMEAVAKVLKATWQRCRVRLRNAATRSPKGRRQTVAAMIRSTFAPETEADARRQRRAIADQLRQRLPKPMDEADVLAFMTFRKAQRLQIHGTSPLERLNAESKHQAPNRYRRQLP